MTVMKKSGVVLLAAAIGTILTFSSCSAPEEKTNHGEMRGLTAKELIAEMKTGWNLGNSLDSIGKDETAWAAGP